MVISATEDKLTIEVTDKVAIRLGRAALEALGDQDGPPGTIRGDLPVSASLSNVWQALTGSLEDIRRRATMPAASPGHGEHKPTEPGTDAA